MSSYPNGYHRKRPAPDVDRFVCFCVIPKAIEALLSLVVFRETRTEKSLASMITIVNNDHTRAPNDHNLAFTPLKTPNFLAIRSTGTSNRTERSWSEMSI